MKHELPPLECLKVFEAAARHLSFSKAAAELCITKSAVTYQIQKLEQALDRSLFRRSVRQVYLTDAGQKLFQVVQSVFKELLHEISQLKPSDRYDVKIAATTYVAARWLSPRVAKFLETNQGASVVFHHDLSSPSYSLDEVDIALTWGKCTNEWLNGSDTNIRMLPMPLFPVCSPEMAKKIESDRGYLSQATLLYEHYGQDLWLEWFGDVSLGNPRQVIEDANVRVQAAIDGQGLIIADAMMESELNSGALVAPFKKQLNGYGYRLQTSTKRNKNQLAAAMLDWLSMA